MSGKKKRNLEKKEKILKAYLRIFFDHYEGIVIHMEKNKYVIRDHVHSSST